MLNIEAMKERYKSYYMKSMLQKADNLFVAIFDAEIGLDGLRENITMYQHEALELRKQLPKDIEEPPTKRLIV